MYVKYQLKRTIEKATFDKVGFQNRVNRCCKGVQEARKALEQEKLHLTKPPFPSLTNKKEKKESGKDRQKSGKPSGRQKENR